MLRVKICGITRESDALFAVKEGADALGFIFAQSPRRVYPDTVKTIVKKVGPLVITVGVFVNESVERMLKTAEKCALNTIQLHGDEDARTVCRLQRDGLKVIKAVRVGEAGDFKKVQDMPADALLFDTSTKERFGGSGRVFDWKVLLEHKIRQPWIVSGGLHPGNVKELLSVLKPYGVDVSSGVETAPGKKSNKLVKDFIRNAKSAR